MITFFDDAQKLHAPEFFTVFGKQRPIPETPKRIDMLMQGVKKLGLEVRKPELISFDQIALVHDKRYLKFMETLLERWHLQPDASDVPHPNVHAIHRDTLVPVSYPEGVMAQAGFHLGDSSCPVVTHTLQSALASASSAVAAAQNVLDGAKVSYALCRPPGHHAASDAAGGFCYFNNSALAAEMLTRAGRRVAVLDVDVHHGNGTEAIFYDRADVLTVSIHCHPKRFYPFYWGYDTELGRGAGEGFNLNLPLEKGADIKTYQPALEVALRRIADFGADTLVVACGLDIAVDDPFQAFAIRTEDFEVIGQQIAAAKLPMVVVQEGGYPSETLGNNLASFLTGIAS